MKTPGGFLVNNRDWFCLALRVFGLWWLMLGIENSATHLHVYLSQIAFSPGWAFLIVWPLLRTASGLLLVLFAPAISCRVYPSPTSDGNGANHAESGSALKIGIQLLGVYALLLAVQSLGTVLPGLFTSGARGGATELMKLIASTYQTELLKCGLNLAFGAILLLGNDRVVTALERLRYVAERDAYTPPPLAEEVRDA
jgi:hypothetical protein